MNELALFAGAGGGILGGVLLGWRTICAVEIDPYARSVLLARQNDGTLAPFPIWDDIRTFDGAPWRGRVDVVSGGFFPARTSAQQEKAPASRASDPAYGWKWPESSAKYDPASRSWKTRQCLLDGDLEPFSETWPRWGSMRDGELSPLPIPELITCANESGLWQTPVADDAIEREKGKYNSRGEPKLSAQVMWGTPTRHDAKGCSGAGTVARGGVDLNLLDKSETQ